MNRYGRQVSSGMLVKPGKRTVMKGDRSMDKEKTGELIRQARTEKGMTQSELGDLIGVTNKAVSRWERGESFPDVAILDHLAECLGLQIEDLVLGEKQSTSDEHVMYLMGVKPRSLFERTLRDLLWEMRLQRKDQQRRYIRIITYMTITIVPAIWGMVSLFSLWNNHLSALTGFYKDGPLIINLIHLILFGVILALTYIIILRSQPLKRNDVNEPNDINDREAGNDPEADDQRLYRVLWWIAAGSGLCIMILMTGSVLFSLYQQEVLGTVGLPDHYSTGWGELLHIQIVLIAISQIVCIIYYYILFVRHSIVSLRNLCMSETVLFLTLIYGTIQRMLSENVWQVLYMVLGYTAGLLLINGVYALVSRVVKSMF
ncbi:MAG: helix-turn-helix transcriptional regulator [Lachnospiraceae bacterium]|nr:helix-turn-helix transcriptional regulator [Lachnospiraceae bacterium]MBR1567710.1 helix-turn-helix transcriptional regulator [Lachnospiraceae bacterium]